MQENTHPETHPVIFRDTSNDEEFKTQSTLTSEETKTVDGTEYYVINIEVSSASHPFYTGEQRFVDTEGQVDKFKAKMEKVEEKQEQSEQETKEKEKEQEENEQQQGAQDLKDLKQAVEKQADEQQKEEDQNTTKDIDYEEIVSQNIPEVKSEVKENNLDPEQVLAAEGANKDRKTLKSWLKDRSESDN